MGEGRHDPGDPGRREGRGRICVALLALGIAFSSAVRIETAFRDPGFDREDPRGLLKSDPALLYYFTSRILDAGWLPPEDFRADPRVQHPGLTDVPAEFTVGQELLVAWLYRIAGGDMPLHAFCVLVMAVVASLAAAGIYGLALALTRSPPLALAAALLHLLLPASYRTIGFVLVREDVALPLFALHLALAARAWRRPSPAAFLLAGAAAALALSSWHAMRLVFAFELAVLLVAFLATGRNPLGCRGAWAAALPVVAAAALIPALREGLYLLSASPAIFLALWLARVAARRSGAAPEGGRAERSLALALGIALPLVGLLVAGALGGTGFAHVQDVLVAKIRHLGRLPADPLELSFDARLLWQGPFATLDPELGARRLGVALPLYAIALATAFRRDVRASLRAHLPLHLAALLSLPCAWLFARAIVLPALLLPPALAVLAAAVSPRRTVARAVPWAVAAALVFQLGSLARFARGYVIPWYQPRHQTEEIALAVDWIRENVPPDEPIVSDFVNSTAVLALAGNPIVLQPKYETERSRRRAEDFLEAYFRGTPEELRRLVRERFRSRYLLVDRLVLGTLSRYTAGLPASAGPLPGSPDELLGSNDPATLTGVPGFELVYRSPESIRRADGRPSDLFRLYRLP